MGQTVLAIKNRSPLPTFRHVPAAQERRYKERRPYRAGNQPPPGAGRQPITVHDLEVRRLLSTRILGGAINEYRYTA